MTWTSRFLRTVVALWAGGGLALALGGTPPAEAACTRSWASAVSGNWSDSAKWSPNGVPASTDEACITADGSYTVTANVTATVANLTVGAAGNASQPTLRIGAATGVTLTVSNDVSNLGAVTLESSVSTYSQALVVTSGVLTNTGALNFNVGSGGGRTLTADLDNQGTVNINYGATFNKTGGSYSNSGTLTIAAGQTLTLTNTPGFTQQSGGDLAVNGSFSQTGGSFTFTGGTLTGNTPVLSNSSLNFGAAATGPGAFQQLGTSSSLSGNVPSGITLRIGGAAHSTTTAASGFTNAGTITLESSVSTYSQALVVTSGVLTNTGALNFNVGSGGTRTLTADLDNQGTVNVNYGATFNKTGGSYSNSGTLTVAAGQTLTLTNSPGFTQQSGGVLAVNGSFSQSGGSFTFNGGALTGNTPVLNGSSLNFGAAAAGAGVVQQLGAGSLSGNVPSGITLRIGGAAHSTTTAASSFTNAGTITLESSVSAYNQVLAVSSGVLTNTGVLNFNAGTGGGRTLSADLDNQGTVNVNLTTAFNKTGGSYSNSGALTIAASQTLTNTGFIQQSGGVLAVNGSFSQSGGSFTFNGGTLTGNTPVLTNSSLSFGAAAAGSGAFQQLGASSSLSGNVPSGITLRIGGAVHSTTTAASGFTNAGTITLESSVSTYNQALVVTSGVLTNTGALNFNASTGGGRTLTADLDNRGTVNVNLTTAFNKTGGSYSNSGTLTIASSRTLTISGAASFTQTAGSTTVSGALSSNVQVTIQGGALSGAGTITGNVSNGGQVRPGSSAGMLTISGAYTQTAGGSLFIEILGLTVGSQYDRLAVSGAATLNGALTVSRNGYTPNANDTFQVLTFGSRSGDFATYTAPGFSRSLTGASLTLTAQEFVAPSCALTRQGVNAQGKKYIEVTTQDTGSGLRSIETTVAVNVTVSIPAFSQGATSPVVVTATKVNQAQGAQVVLRVKDLVDNVTVCDPVLVELVVERGEGTARQTVTGVPAEESLVTVANGTPGLRVVEVVVNGKVFVLGGLRAGEVRTVDVARAMRPGAVNRITLAGAGRPGSRADVTIWGPGQPAGPGGRRR